MEHFINIWKVMEHFINIMEIDEIFHKYNGN